MLPVPLPFQEKENKLFKERLMNEPGPSSGSSSSISPTSGSSSSIERDKPDGISDIPEEVLRALQDEDNHYDNDALIAQMLQAQFDLDHDAELRTFENHKNKNSKVKISYKNYQCVPDNWLDNTPRERDEEMDSKQPADWDRFDTVEREFNQVE